MVSVDLGDLEEESAAYTKKRAEVKNDLAEIVNLHKKLVQTSEKLEEVPLSNKKLRKKWMGKVARGRVAVSLAIRNVTFYLAQWK